MPVMPPISVGGYEGAYTSYAHLIQRFGTTNIADWSNTEGTGTLDEDHVAAAIDHAEADVDAFFNGAAYAIPFTATGASLPHQISEWATVLAGYWLYTRRGQHDEGDTMGGKMQGLRDEVYADMAKYKAGFRRLSGVTMGTGLTAPTSIAPVRDPLGFPNNTTLSPNRLGRPYGYGGWY